MPDKVIVCQLETHFMYRQALPVGFLVMSLDQNIGGFNVPKKEGIATYNNVVLEALS